MTAAPQPLLFGVDVGGTKVAAAAVEEGAARAQVERPTERTSADALLDGVEEAVAAVAGGVGRPEAVGVGVPSQIDFATGTVMASVNIPLAGIQLRGELERRLGTAVFVDNDANCAALAEARAARGDRVSNLVMLTLGTGVGGGVVIDGAIFRGATGLGAELGHLVVDADGPPCPGDCPNRGCLEALCSGQALARDATQLGRAAPDSRLGRVVAERGRATGEDVVAAARAGDAEAARLFERFSSYLGAAMSGLVNALEPELLVVGGGLARAADLFFEAAIAEAKARALPSAAGRVRFAPARGGPAAGVIGAGLLAAGELERAAASEEARP